jgi:hypothetical protein
VPAPGPLGELGLAPGDVELGGVVGLGGVDPLGGAFGSVGDV